MNKEDFEREKIMYRKLGKKLADLLLNPKGDWNNVCYRSAIITKLLPIFMRFREDTIKQIVRELK